jgi:AhpC/TSA family
VKWTACGLLAALLTLPAAWGDDPPKDKDQGALKDEKAPSAKERYDALVKEYRARQNEIVAEIRKAKRDERKDLSKKYRGLAGEYVDRFLKVAEENPKDPVAADAWVWLFQNAETDTAAHKKAAERLLALITELPLKDLTAKLSRVGATEDLQAAALKRAEKDQQDPAAGDLVAWAATNGGYLKGAQTVFDRLVEKYPDHKQMERVCRILGQRDDLPGAEATLKKILERNTSPKVQATAHYALGELVAGKVNEQGDDPAKAEKLAAEAEKYFTKAAELYGGDNPNEQENAQQEVKTLKTRRVGLPAPDIKGPDLDGKEFRLSDYRGKVVLLDFWGDW